MTGFTVAERLAAPSGCPTFWAPHHLCLSNLVFILASHIVLVSVVRDTGLKSWSCCLVGVSVEEGLVTCRLFHVLFRSVCFCALVRVRCVHAAARPEVRKQPHAYRCPADRRLVLPQFCPGAKCEPPSVLRTKSPLPTVPNVSPLACSLPFPPELSSKNQL